MYTNLIHQPCPWEHVTQGNALDRLVALPFFVRCTVGLWVIGHNEKEHRQKGQTRKWQVLLSAGLDLVLITYREHSVN